MLVDLVHGGRSSLGPQIWSKATCPLKIWRRMIDLTLAATLDYLKKNNNKAYGGPGIRTQVLLDIGCTPLPLSHCVLIVSILNKNNNKTKRVILPENKKSARKFEWSNQRETRLSSLTFKPCKFTCGFRSAAKFVGQPQN